ncbi:hypothetical protein FA95DRAFT_303197 [Auriscalpium vulgare]|uniref:Uncharacterized protein n=1 Tax=Auriscalpium vulgare TaxID=40419 RepID=A0ACB8RJ43_9AGAM|nr:hypothetical protein FA95DRAFT_303197 [Auriscalpium vulgare]
MAALSFHLSFSPHLPLIYRFLRSLIAPFNGPFHTLFISFQLPLAMRARVSPPYPSIDWVLAASENPDTVRPLPPRYRVPQDNQTTTTQMAEQQDCLRRVQSEDHMKTVDYRYARRPIVPRLPAGRPPVRSSAFELPPPAIAASTDSRNSKCQQSAETPPHIPKIVIEDWDDMQTMPDALTADSSTMATSREANGRGARRRMKVLSKKIFALFAGMRGVTMRRVKTVEQLENDLKFDLLN